jgi:hypothetical protein
VRCSCLNRWLTQMELKSSLKNKNQVWILVRERRARALDLKGVFQFSEWPTALGGRWGSIYSPHLKRAVGRTFHQTSSVRPPDKSGGSLWKPVKKSLEASPELDNSGATTGQVRWGYLESDPDSLETGGFIRQVW